MSATDEIMRLADDFAEPVGRHTLERARKARDALLKAVEALEKDAACMRWLDSNSTFMDVDHDWPVEDRNIPVLACVSSRIWYHATDDVVSYPLSAVVDAAMQKETP